jgi:hypothetical protein
LPFVRLSVIFLFDVFNRCFMCSFSTYAICCPEHARLEDEYLAARDRLRNSICLRTLSRLDERRLADDMAMAIARLKEHLAAHGCERQ